MSKAAHSPLGQWRGRTGGQVYRVRNGQQIVSSYQPAVANPKSDAQLLQRAKFNLMTKLNALFDARLLNGYSSSKGVARAMFSKNLMPGIYAQLLDGPGERKYRANIAPVNIVFGPNKENFIKASQSVASHIQLAPAGTVARLTFTNLGGLFDVDASVARIRFVDVFGSSVFDYSEVMVDSIEGTTIANMQPTLDFSGTGVHRLYLQVLDADNSLLNDFRGGSVVNAEAGDDNVIVESGASYASSYIVGGSYYIGSVEIADNRGGSDSVASVKASKSTKE